MDPAMIQDMDSEMIQETPYIAAMDGEWQHMIDYYKENLKYLFSPVTLSLDTGFHLAVHSNEKQPLKDLLEIMEGREFFLTETRNEFGNTVLHEATIYGNYEAVRFLVECCPDLISITNNFGETPLFTAAGFGEAEIVEFLIRFKPEQCVDDNGHLMTSMLSFLSMMTSMLSFGSTILILVQSGTKLTTLLLSVASFLPVLVFTIMQFHLYVSFLDSTYGILKTNILKITRKALTPFLVPCLRRGKMPGLKKKEKKLDLNNIGD